MRGRFSVTLSDVLTTLSDERGVKLTFESASGGRENLQRKHGIK
jgi:hypothetical protein